MSANASAKYGIGIDLGTTNSVVAFTRLSDDSRAVELLSLPQIVAPATIEPRPALPSFLYLASESEGAAGTYDLPWAKGARFAVGEFARKQSADVPTRTVANAKSWLCHNRVDRRQPILPWNAPAEVPKISPVEASLRYLAQMAAAWNHAHADAPIAKQKVVLTVPASFDASARELTREAALAAGLPENLVLLEEPQAALYAWLADAGQSWRRQLKEGDTLLVCDIGGGTTDFSLIRVTAEAGQLELKRIAVGNHILVGGDNMDLTLAHSAQSAFGEKGVEVDPWQSVALWHACRAAKETLLSVGGPRTQPVAILGRGKKLIGGTISVDLVRETILAALLDGFFPPCKLSDQPASRRASGFREIGLPYETDAAITRHLARFLTQQSGTDSQTTRPTHVLFNGGVLKATALRERLLEVIGSWFPGGAPTVLEGNNDFDFAVARGASYYAAAKEGKGMRIRGGTARSYYVGIETAGLAIPGAMRPLRALCVVPFGMEEGTETTVPGEEIGLVVGEPGHFRFFASAVRKEDQPGQMLNRWSEDELTESDPLETTLSAAEGAEDGFVPVHFESRITELGMLELWCVSTVSDERWKLEFSVREET
ncbi:MAG: DnaK-related protein [Chthoniobacteraceae bacterium]|nr:DnaK-related protein [Chthoniobacteraceae bacterium]